MKVYERQEKIEVPFGLREGWIWGRWYLFSILVGLVHLPFLCLRSAPYVLKNCPMFIVFWVCLGADYWLKGTFSNLLANNRSIELIPGFATLTLVHNEGAAFGLLEGFGSLFILMALVTGAFILFYLAIYHREDRRICWSLVLILAGALGNMIDRVMYGYVIDYVLLYYRDFRWPVFNFADIVINLGVALILLDMLIELRTGEDSEREC
jgi:signal peptidase II